MWSLNKPNHPVYVIGGLLGLTIIIGVLAIGIIAHKAAEKDSVYINNDSNETILVGLTSWHFQFTEKETESRPIKPNGTARYVLPRDTGFYSAPIFFEESDGNRVYYCWSEPFSSSETPIKIDWSGVVPANGLSELRDVGEFCRTIYQKAAGY